MPIGWSHVRRRFYEIAQGGNAPIAEQALERIAALYRIEAGIRGLVPEQRRALRHDQSRPIVDELRAWLDTTLARLPRRSRTAEAIRSALKLWSGLTVFLDDGRVEIDSNTVERSIRPIALNRKHALFAGSDQGGVHRGVIASLIETCKLNAVDPQAYWPALPPGWSTAVPPARSTSSCPGPALTTCPENRAYRRPVLSRPWLLAMVKRRPVNVTAIALAYKTAGAGWAMLTRQ